MKSALFGCLLLAALPGAAQERPLPPGFVDLREAVPGIVLDLRYAGSHNFVGAPIDGYVRPRALLTHLAAAALGKAQKDLAPFGFGPRSVRCWVSTRCWA